MNSISRSSVFNFAKIKKLIYTAIVMLLLFMPNIFTFSNYFRQKTIKYDEEANYSYLLDNLIISRLADKFDFPIKNSELNKQTIILSDRRTFLNYSSTTSPHFLQGHHIKVYQNFLALFDIEPTDGIYYRSFFETQHEY
jgi:hypothetical protein